MSALTAAAWMPEVETGGWEAQLLRSRTGVVQRVLANAALPLRHAPEFKGALRHNQLTLRAEATRPMPWGHVGTMDDQQARLYAEWLQHREIHVPAEIAGQALEMVARERASHPIREYLNTLEHWDGKRRLSTWLAIYLGVQHTEYTRAVGQIGRAHV